jgi:hypothetical protein
VDYLGTWGALETKLPGCVMEMLRSCRALLELDHKAHILFLSPNLLWCTPPSSCLLAMPSHPISKSEDSWHDLIWKVVPGAVAKALDAAHLARRPLVWSELASYVLPKAS